MPYVERKAEMIRCRWCKPSRRGRPGRSRRWETSKCGSAGAKNLFCHNTTAVKGCIHKFDSIKMKTSSFYVFYRGYKCPLENSLSTSNRASESSRNFMSAVLWQNMFCSIGPWSTKLQISRPTST